VPQPPERSIREVLLEVVKEQDADRSGGNLQQTSVLNAAAKRLEVATHGDLTREEALLTVWHDLFRTGILAWGYNLMNPNPPFLHLTARGRQAIERISRDPSNPAGYLRHLTSAAQISPVTNSYIVEALDCYVAGLFKAAAVMVGAAAENVILEVRDTVASKLITVGKNVPSQLESWKIKTVTDALSKVFEQIDGKRHRELREQYEAYWGAFPHQIRTTRNDAGHPFNIDPVTPDTVHASLLIFPELAKLADTLSSWARDELS
jgi:hypothetical protein